MSSQRYDPLLHTVVDYVYDYQPTRNGKAWETAQLAFLDALGCAAECLTSDTETCHALLGPFVPETTTYGGFRLPGTTYELDPVKGAFDLGMLIRFLDHNDGFIGLEFGHPSDNLGAICAVADYVSRRQRSQGQSSGPTVDTILVSLIKAYEVQGRLQLANSLHARGLDHVFLEKFAACAAVCPILDLTRKQALATLSHCILDNAPLRTYRHAPNTIPRKGWAGGDAGSRAVQLALLAKKGQPGAPTALSAPRWGFEDSVLGIAQGREVGSETITKRFELGGPSPGSLNDYVIQNIFFKLMPCEGHALAAVEACLEALADLGLDNLAEVLPTIKHVHIRGTHGMVFIISKPASLTLNNPADRDHCLEYMLAVTLLRGSAPDVSDYYDNSHWASSDQVDRLREIMTVTEDEQFTQDFHDPAKRSIAGAVRLEFNNGNLTGEVVVQYPIGHPKNPKTADTVEAKYMKNLGRLYDEVEIQKVISMVKHDDAVAVYDLFDILWKGNGQ